MDKTEQYIKMCDCPEIQEGKVGFRSTDDFVYVEDKKRAYCIWLPRQDQVQEMMGANNKEPFCDWLSRLEKFLHLVQPWDVPIDKGGLKTIGWLETWEQLWLAFYMKEKRGKAWNGEKWLKG